MSIRLYLSTRGSSLDYRFLGQAPETSWWTTIPYSQQTRYEKPTLIAEVPHRAYYSGIPSQRKDRVQTTIRYTLVLELDNPTEAEFRRWAALTRLWLESRDELGQRLDQFVNTRVEDWLERSVQKEDITPEVMHVLESLWLTFPESEWVTCEDCAFQVSQGGLALEENRKKFLCQFSSLLQTDAKGVLAVLNQAEEDEDLDALLAIHPQQAICLLGRGDAPLKKKTAPAPQAHTHRRPVTLFGSSVAAVETEPPLKKRGSPLTSLTEQLSPWLKSSGEKVQEAIRKTTEGALKSGSEVLKSGSEALKTGSEALKTGGAAALKTGSEALKTGSEALKTSSEALLTSGEALLTSGEKTLEALFTQPEDEPTSNEDSPPSDATSEEATSEEATSETASTETKQTSPSKETPESAKAAHEDDKAE